VRLVLAVAVALAGSTWLGLVAGTPARGAQAGHLAVSSTLNAGFDADGNIYLTFADGTRIGAPSPPGTVVPAGTYTIVLSNNSLDDLGNPHSFHLFGPGVNLAAGNAIQATWTATFQPASTYTYQDDLNPTTIHDVFGTPGSGATSTTVPVTTTTAVPTGTSTTTTTAKPTSNSPLSQPAPFRGTLDATVTPAGGVTLTKGGKAVGTLTTGRYRFKVTDGSTRAGFDVQQSTKSVHTVTGTSFTGTKSVTITLAAGQWFFYGTVVGKKTYFVVVR